jgi:hypothetical protein
VTEVSLKDRDGKEAGNIDMVLVSYDARGRILDYGAVEIQAVYISGNVRQPFEYYMDDPSKRAEMIWKGRPHYPRPDYLSSSRKRLAPQLMFKGGILHAWKRKTAVILDSNFFKTLPELPQVPKGKADIAWLVYDLHRDAAANKYALELSLAVYTQFQSSLDRITKAEPGDETNFLADLQDKLDKKLENDNPPDAPILQLG